MTTRKQLTAQTATITTAAVEVKTLTISGKQVTLAVFRQLLEEPILDELTAELTGQPWGFVNYHPDKCTDQPGHLHIVWQRGDELRRATVQAPEVGHHTHPAADLYVQARILHRTIHGPWSEPRAGDILRLSERLYDGTWSVFADGRFTYDGMSFRGSIPASLRKTWVDERQPNGTDWEALEAERVFLGIPDAASHDSLVGELLSMLPTTRYRQSWAELVTLPQLFIAV